MTDRGGDVPRAPAASGHSGGQGRGVVSQAVTRALAPTGS